MRPYSFDNFGAVQFGISLIRFGLLYSIAFHFARGSRRRKLLNSITTLKNAIYLPITFGCFLGALVIQSAISAEPKAFDRKLSESAFNSLGEGIVKCSYISDEKGKPLYTLARMSHATYKIPQAYNPVGDCRSSILFSFTWTSKSGILEFNRPGTNIQIILEAPRRTPVQDSYATAKRLGKTVRDKTPTEYPGLFRVYWNGQLTPDFMSGDTGPKTPQGNPFYLHGNSVQSGNNAHIEYCCDTTIALAGGGSIRIKSNYMKDLGDWARLFPAVIRLVQSFEQKE